MFRLLAIKIFKNINKLIINFLHEFALNIMNIIHKNCPEGREGRVIKGLMSMKRARVTVLQVLP